MTIARRAAIRLGFGAALAGPSAAKEMAKSAALMLGSQYAAEGAGQFSDGPPSPGYPNPIREAAQKLFHDSTEDRNFGRLYRAGVLDHDIFVCQSWSLAYKAALQKQRDNGEKSFMKQLYRAAFL